ncbi:MAG: hypothetical protein IKM43_03000 [Clostridia bacterium]|nr:hypothetical protein [Clostridia bacterium]
MEDKYKVFSEKFNKVLDLVEKVDSFIATKYKYAISKLPKSFVQKLNLDKDFSMDGKTSKYDIAYDDLFVELQHIEYKDFKDTLINIKPIMMSDLECDFDIDDYDEETREKILELNEELECDEDENMLFLFSLVESNSETDDARIEFHFDEVGDDYIFKGFNENNKAQAWEYEVFLDDRDDGYYLVSRIKFNTVLIRQQEVSIGYEELLDYVIEDDNEIDFDGEAEYDEESGEYKLTYYNKEENKEHEKEPEVEVEFFIELPPEEDELDDKTDYYTP